MDNLLVFLEGKKAVISQILSAIIVYLMATGVLDNYLGALLQTIVLLLTGGAVLTVNAAVKNETALGRAIINQRINNK